MLQTKRVYEAEKPADGLRILIDKLWPRGIKKEDLALDEWVKEVAPSDKLRRWFGHKPEKWSDFLKEYHQELDENESSWLPILKKSRHHRVTLLYGSKDTEHNNAIALKQYLESKH